MRTSWSLIVLLSMLLAFPASAPAAGPATHFVVVLTASVNAGQPFVFGLLPKDASGAEVDGFGGTLHFSSSDPQATLQPDTTVTPAEEINGGFGIFATLRTAGPQTITVTLTDGSITGTSAPAPVVPAPATRLTIGAPSLATTGVPLTFTITARDPFNNKAPTYNGTVHFTSNDPAATVPADAQLTGGAGTFTATLQTAGVHTLTGTDPAIGFPFAATASITVARPAARLEIAGPDSTLIGFPTLVGVRALDATGAVASTYSGTVHFSSSDPKAGLPDDVKLVNGNATALLTFATPGLQTIAAADTAVSSIAGTSRPVVVGVVTPPPPSPPPDGGTAPPPPPAPPAIRGLAVKPLCVAHPRLLGAPRRGRGALAISFTLSAGARVTVSLERLVHAAAPARCPRSAGSTKGAVKLVRTLSGPAASGRNALAIASGVGRRTVVLAGAAAAKAPAPGAYLVQVRATDAAGRRSALATAKFFVLR